MTVVNNSLIVGNERRFVCQTISFIAFTERLLRTIDIFTRRRSRSSVWIAGKASVSRALWPCTGSSIWTTRRTSVRNAAAASTSAPTSRRISSRTPTSSPTSVRSAEKCFVETATSGDTLSPTRRPTVRNNSSRRPPFATRSAGDRIRRLLRRRRLWTTKTSLTSRTKVEN
jgi:hypothetical protein